MSYGMTITIFPGNHAHEFKMHVDKSTWEENRCTASENIINRTVTTETQMPESADTNLWMIPVMEYVYEVVVQAIVSKRDGRGVTPSNGHEYFSEENRSSH